MVRYLITHAADCRHGHWCNTRSQDTTWRTNILRIWWLDNSADQTYSHLGVMAAPPSALHLLVSLAASGAMCQRESFAFLLWKASWWRHWIRQEDARSLWWIQSWWEDKISMCPRGRLKKDLIPTSACASFCIEDWKEKWKWKRMEKGQTFAFGVPLVAQPSFQLGKIPGLNSTQIFGSTFWKRTKKGPVYGTNLPELERVLCRCSVGTVLDITCFQCNTSSFLAAGSLRVFGSSILRPSEIDCFKDWCWRRWGPTFLTGGDMWWSVLFPNSWMHNACAR